jgi:simple sugar transport system substrate-binding protein
MRECCATPNWQIIERQCGDFTRAKASEVMEAILEKTRDIDVVYCENDGEALGAIDAMEKAGLKCGAEDGVIVISFDATRLGLNTASQERSRFPWNATRFRART